MTMSKNWINLNSKIYDIESREINDNVCPICGSKIEGAKSKPMILKSVLTNALLVLFQDDDLQWSRSHSASEMSLPFL